MEKKENKITWTDEQNEIISEMIKASEDIGFVQGHDDAIKELIKQLEMMVFELKKGIYRREYANPS